MKNKEKLFWVLGIIIILIIIAFIILSESFSLAGKIIISLVILAGIVRWIIIATGDRHTSK